MKELKKEELMNSNGGSILGAAALIVGAAIYGELAMEVLFEGSAKCWQDFLDGYNSVKKY